MEIRVRATGAVMFESEWRQWLRENNGPSFGELTPEIMDELGADPVFEGPQATPTTVYEYSQRQGVELQSDGKWYTKYVIGPVFTAYTDGEGVTHTVEEQQAAWIAQKDAELRASNEATAKRLLEESDWAELASVRDAANTPHLTNGADFDAYRVALRAIVVDPPVTVDPWPTRPSAVWS